jgi:hypothetical protein
MRPFMLSWTLSRTPSCPVDAQLYRAGMNTLPPTLRRALEGGYAVVVVVTKMVLVLCVAALLIVLVVTAASQGGTHLARDLLPL